MRLIAEFCQNHNGNFDILLRMIDAAAMGGATHGKIQTIFTDDLSFRDRFEKGTVGQDGSVQTIHRPYQAEYDRLKNLELTYEQHVRFGQACRNAGIEPMTTAFTLTAIPELDALGWKAIKVASYDCGSLPLIETLAEHFDEIVLSTGASTNQEIESAARFLSDRNKSFVLLHCVTIYPTLLSEMHLSRLKYLRTLCPSVGLSDHSLVSRDGVKAALAALYLGADTIERHFTILPEDQTRDGKVSIGKDHLRQIADFARLPKNEQAREIERNIPELASMLGDPGRSLSHAEILNRDYYRGRFCNKIAGRQIFNWEDDARSIISRSHSHLGAE